MAEQQKPKRTLNVDLAVKEFQPERLPQGSQTTNVDISDPWGNTNQLDVDSYLGGKPQESQVNKPAEAQAPAKLTLSATYPETYSPSDYLKSNQKKQDLIFHYQSNNF